MFEGVDEEGQDDNGYRDLVDLTARRSGRYEKQMKDSQILNRVDQEDSRRGDGGDEEGELFGMLVLLPP